MPEGGGRVPRRSVRSAGCGRSVGFLGTAGIQRSASWKGSAVWGCRVQRKCSGVASRWMVQWFSCQPRIHCPAQPSSHQCPALPLGAVSCSGHRAKGSAAVPQGILKRDTDTAKAEWP